MTRSPRGLLALTAIVLLSSCQELSAPVSAAVLSKTHVASTVETPLVTFGVGGPTDGDGYSEGGLTFTGDDILVVDANSDGDRELVASSYTEIWGITTAARGLIEIAIESGSATVLLRAWPTGALVAIATATAPQSVSFYPLAAGSYMIELWLSSPSLVLDDIVVGVFNPDNTPPAITPSVTGDVGTDGWYTSDVAVSWAVSDAESAITTQNGCTPTVVAADTPGVAFTCTASSAGGTNSASVTIRRDATAPVITFSGAVAYSADQKVSIACSATDATSEVASDSCLGASAPAYTFDVGENVLSASATNGAGLSTSATVTFAVTVDHAALATLTSRFITNAGLARALNEKLAASAAAAAAGHAEASAGLLRAYVSQLGALAGKAISAADAAILTRLASAL